MQNGVDHFLANNGSKQLFLTTRDKEVQEFLDDLHKQHPKIYTEKERDVDKVNIIRANHKQKVIDDHVRKRKLKIEKALRKLQSNHDFRYRTNEQIQSLVPQWEKPKVSKAAKGNFEWIEHHDHVKREEEEAKVRSCYRKQRIDTGLKQLGKVEEAALQEAIHEGFYEAHFGDAS